MWERKIEAPSWERSWSWRRRRGVGNFCLRTMGAVVVDVGGSGVDDVGGGFDDMAGDIVESGCWK